MYWCSVCGAFFVKPRISRDRETLEGRRLETAEERCPCCGGDGVREAGTCRNRIGSWRCGEPAPPGETLCPSCAALLSREVERFLQGRTAAEAEVLREALDGTVIAPEREDRT